jgi:hypothetical protein
VGGRFCTRERGENPARRPSDRDRSALFDLEAQRDAATAPFPQLASEIVLTNQIKSKISSITLEYKLFATFLTKMMVRLIEGKDFFSLCREHVKCFANPSMATICQSEYRVFLKKTEAKALPHLIN